MTMMMDGKNVAGIILAAGRGRRMRSRIAKPLHCVAGRELARYPAELLAECGVAPVAVVVAPEQRDAIAGVLGEGVIYALQATPDGTAGAAAAGIAALPEAPATVIITGGDTPLVRPESVCRLLAGSYGRRCRRPADDHSVGNGRVRPGSGRDCAGRPGRQRRR